MLDFETIKEGVFSLRSLDFDLKVFDIVMETQSGTSYNSYVLEGDDAICLLDTTKEEFIDEYIEALERNFDLKKIKYIVVNHTEPDHSGEVGALLEKMPWLTLVGTPSALAFLQDISNHDFSSLEVKQDTLLSLGGKTLSFVIAPNLHWPDSMFTYLKEEKMLFTCDVFGAHFATHKYYADELDFQEEAKYSREFEYYFQVIFGPFKPYVKQGLTLLEGKELDMILPAHGPMLRTNLEKYLDSYANWSCEHEIENDKIALVYVSAYGYTKRVAEEVASGIRDKGFRTVLLDLLEVSEEQALHEVYTSYAFLVGSPTLNGDTTPNMWSFLQKLNHYNSGAKLAGAFGAFGWSGEAVRNIESRLSQVRAEVYRPGLRIKFNPNSPQKLQKCKAFGEAFGAKAKSLQEVLDNKEWSQIKTGLWRCLICGEVFEGEEPPESCPVCMAPSDQFVSISRAQEELTTNYEGHVVIVGSGVASVSAIEAMRKRSSKVKITLVSEEDCLPYMRVLLSKHLGKQDQIDEIKPESWFSEMGVELRLNTAVFKVLENKQELLLQSGETISYDKLLIATGARVNRFPVLGDDKQGVFTLRSKKDFEEITQFANQDNVSKIIIVGGGILGVEMASSLRYLGKELEIIEFAPRLMGRQLDDDGARLFQKHLNSQGIAYRCSESLEEIYGTGVDFREVCGVKLKSSQEKLDCQMIIFSTGVKANLELIEGTKIASHRGIIVDSSMKTSVEGIYAAGDVTEFEGKSIGLWSIALAQGEVAGAQLVGDDSLRYSQSPISVSFNALGYKIFSLGDLGFDHDQQEYQILELSDQKQEVYRKFYFYENQFVGGILMGDTSKALQLRKALDKASTMQHFLDMHFLDENL